MDENDKRRLVLKLIARLRCVECGELYNPHDFSLVHRSEDVWVLGAECRHCGSSSHVVIAMHLDADREPVIDLTPDEMSKVDRLPPITVDDVLDIHELLQEFDGDFETFLAR